MTALAEAVQQLRSVILQGDLSNSLHYLQEHSTELTLQKAEASASTKIHIAAPVEEHPIYVLANCGVQGHHVLQFLIRFDAVGGLWKNWVWHASTVAHLNVVLVGCQTGDLEVVRILVRSLLKVVATDEMEEAFYFSCEAGHDGIVRFLLEEYYLQQKVRIPAEALVRFAYSTHVTCLDDYLPLAQLLIGSEPRIIDATISKDGVGYTALHLCALKQSPQLAALLLQQSPGLLVVKDLLRIRIFHQYFPHTVLQQIAEPAAEQQDHLGMLPIHYAVARCDLQLIEVLCEGRSASQCGLDTLGGVEQLTPVHIAAASGNLRCLAALKQYGANTSLPMRSTHQLPTHIGLLFEYEMICAALPLVLEEDPLLQSLLQPVNSSSITATTVATTTTASTHTGSGGFSSVSFFAYIQRGWLTAVRSKLASAANARAVRAFRESPTQNSAAHVAATVPDWDMCQAVLMAYGANDMMEFYNADGLLPSHIAAMRGNVLFFHSLASLESTEHWINARTRSPARETVLLLSIKHHHIELASFLLAQCRPDATIADAMTGDTVLHHSIQCLNVQLIQQLCTYAPSLLNLVNHKHQTALTSALQLTHARIKEQMVGLLLEQGAKLNPAALEYVCKSTPRDDHFGTSLFMEKPYEYEVESARSSLTSALQPVQQPAAVQRRRASSVPEFEEGSLANRLASMHLFDTDENVLHALVSSRMPKTLHTVLRELIRTDARTQARPDHVKSVTMDSSTVRRRSSSGSSHTHNLPSSNPLRRSTSLSVASYGSASSSPPPPPPPPRVRTYSVQSSFSKQSARSSLPSGGSTGSDSFRRSRSLSGPFGSARLARTQPNTLKLLNDDTCENDWTPLHLATIGGSAELVDELLRAGSNIDVTSGEKLHVLHFAAILPDSKVLHHLLQHMKSWSKSVEVLDACGRTPLHYACMAGEIDATIALLDARSSPTRPDAFGRTPLHYAAQFGHLPLVSLLLSVIKPYDDLMDNELVNPLMLAAAQGHLEVCSQLLGAGAPPNNGDAYGNTALHYAVRQKQLPVSFLLARQGCSPTLKNVYGSSSLRLAGQHSAKWAEKLNRKHHEYVRVIQEIEEGDGGAAAADNLSSDSVQLFLYVAKTLSNSSYTMTLPAGIIHNRIPAFLCSTLERIAENFVSLCELKLTDCIIPESELSQFNTIVTMLAYPNLCFSQTASCVPPDGCHVANLMPNTPFIRRFLPQSPTVLKQLAFHNCLCSNDIDYIAHHLNSAVTLSYRSLCFQHCPHLFTGIHAIQSFCKLLSLTGNLLSLDLQHSRFHSPDVFHSFLQALPQTCPHLTMIRLQSCSLPAVPDLWNTMGRSLCSLRSLVRVNISGNPATDDCVVSFVDALIDCCPQNSLPWHYLDISRIGFSCTTVVKGVVRLWRYLGEMVELNMASNRLNEQAGKILRRLVLQQRHRQPCTLLLDSNQDEHHSKINPSDVEAMRAVLRGAVSRETEAEDLSVSVLDTKWHSQQRVVAEQEEEEVEAEAKARQEQEEPEDGDVGRASLLRMRARTLQFVKRD